MKQVLRIVRAGLRYSYGIDGLDSGIQVLRFFGMDRKPKVCVSIDSLHAIRVPRAAAAVQRQFPVPAHNPTRCTSPCPPTVLGMFCAYLTIIVRIS